jgi:uncharacterized protein YjiS (DUF1127 family)
MLSIINIRWINQSSLGITGSHRNGASNQRKECNMTRLLASPKGQIAGPYDLFGAARAVLALLMSVAQRWENRRAVKNLLDWDDHALRDIGLTRADVRLALGLRFTEDPSARLSNWVSERRAARLSRAERDARPVGEGHLRLVPRAAAIASLMARR